MNTKDKGLRKALQKRPAVKLSSNFCYQTMAQLNEQQLLNERRLERRIFIAWAITLTILMTAGFGYLGWMYFTPLMNLCRQVWSWMPEKETFIYALPSLTALILLIPFNRWLQKTMCPPEGNGQGLSQSND